MIRRLAAKRDNLHEIAVIEGEKTISYGGLIQKISAVQRLLPRKGKGKAAIFLPNGSDYIAALYAVIMSGETAFPLNASMTEHEILPLLKQAAVDTVITSVKHGSFFAGSGLNVIYMEELSEEESAPEYIDVPSDRPMVLLSTSGTTGKSKIVQLSESNVEAAVLGYMDKMYYEGIDDVRYAFALPYSCAYGLMIISVCLIKSFPIVVLSDNLTLDSFYRSIEEHRVTHYEGGASVILMMEQMAGRPVPYDISSLGYMAFGGSKVSGRIVNNLMRAFPGIEFYQGYGMTEASPLITKRPLKPGSAGTVIRGVDIAFESDGVITHAPYTKGEIVVKGPNVMMGYYENEEETKNTIKNGYLYTGDIGYMDEDGELYICGRKKNLIIVRGFNVHPEEVEECALNSSLIEDCLVYGRTDGAGNETVCIDIVPAGPQIEEEDIRAYFKAHLSAYKQPRIIRVCERIEKNTSGKSKRDKGGAK